MKPKILGYVIPLAKLKNEESYISNQGTLTRLNAIQ